MKEPALLFKGFTHLFKSHIEQKQITLEVPFHTKGPPELVEKVKERGLKIEVNLVYQILYNVFFNACKFNKQEGSIEMGIEILEFSEEGKAKLLIEVKDTGIGMDKAQKNKLFKLFETVRQD